MPISKLSSVEDFSRYMEKRLQRIETAVIVNLCLLGEQCVKKARTDGNYTDQTGNLRGSVGCVVVANGRIVGGGGFSSDYGSKDGDGVGAGQDFARKIAGEYSKGYALVVVAGMNYAVYVEAMKNKVVLSTAESYAKERLPIVMEKLSRQIAAV